MKRRTIIVAGSYLHLTGVVVCIGIAALTAVVAGCVLIEGAMSCMASEREE